jgi:hypothetical protein
VRTQTMDAPLACGFHGPEAYSLSETSERLAVSIADLKWSSKGYMVPFRVTASSCGLLRSKASLEREPSSAARLGAFRYE